MPYDLLLTIAAPGTPPAEVARIQEDLVTELNERGPIAEIITKAGEPGTRGVLQVAGQVGVALLSGGLLKHIAQVLVAVAKRNKKIEIEVPGLKITTEHVSAKDVERIVERLSAILIKKEPSQE